MAARAKPRLRGVMHQIACGLALVAGAILVVMAPTARGKVAAAIFSGCLVLLYGVSALYHRKTWTPRARAWMRRADHSAIFFLIAGSYTPFCLFLPAPIGSRQLLIMWMGAALGVLRALLWVNAPKIVNAATYIALGWVAIWFVPALRLAVEARDIWLLAVGGVAYSIGAAIYALKRPDPWPQLLGYHELFHALTIVGGAFHFAAAADVIRQMPNLPR